MPGFSSDEFCFGEDDTRSFYLLGLMHGQLHPADRLRIKFLRTDAVETRSENSRGWWIRARWVPLQAKLHCLTLPVYQRSTKVEQVSTGHRDDEGRSEIWSVVLGETEWKMACNTRKNTMKTWGVFFPAWQSSYHVTPWNAHWDPLCPSSVLSLASLCTSNRTSCRKEELDAVINLMTMSIESSGHPVNEHAIRCTADVLLKTTSTFCGLCAVEAFSEYHVESIEIPIL